MHLRLSAAICRKVLANRMSQHEHFMRLAIELAGHAPDHPFGALIADTKSDEIIARGWNRSAIDPTLHGEMDALHQLARAETETTHRSLALYTTAEPCPMCQSAILWTGIETVVYGTSIPYLKALGWNQIDIRAREVIRQTKFQDCELVGGILEDECNSLFEQAVRRKA